MKSGASRLNLKLKLLLPTAIIMAISIAALSLIIVSSEQRQLEELRREIMSSVRANNEETVKQFKLVDQDVGRNLGRMTETVGPFPGRIHHRGVKKGTGHCFRPILRNP